MPANIVPILKPNEFPYFIQPRSPICSNIESTEKVDVLRDFLGNKFFRAIDPL